MKTPSSDLFHLIKALTKSEKRYFKLNSVRSAKATKYLKIFEAMDQMEEYDEAEIKKKFKNEPWISRFNSAKDYLSTALLEALVQYNQSKEIKYRLSDTILHIRVLQEKGFYNRCQQMINKAVKMAWELNDYHRLLELYEIEGFNHPAGINSKNREKILKNQLTVLELLASEFQYANIYKFSFEIFAISGYRGIHNHEENLKKINKLIQNPLYKDIRHAKTFQAKWRFMNMHYINSAGNKDMEEMFKWITSANELFEENPKLKLQHALNYSVTLLNLQEAFVKRKDFKSALDVVETLRTFHPRHLLRKHDRLTYFIDYASTHQELDILCRIGEHKEALKKIPEFRRLQKTYSLEISSDIVMQQSYLEAQIFFGAKAFKEANTILDLIIRNGIEARQDIRKKARILLLASYFEMQKFDLLEYSLRSTHRIFQRSNSLTKLDKAILQIFQILLENAKITPEISIKLRDNVKKVQEFQASDVDYFEIIQWFNAKIRGTSIAEQAKHELQKNPDLNKIRVLNYWSNIIE